MGIFQVDKYVSSLLEQYIYLYLLLSRVKRHLDIF